MSPAQPIAAQPTAAPASSPLPITPPSLPLDDGNTQILHDAVSRYGRDELARMLQVNPKTIARWQTGHHHPKTTVLALLRSLQQSELTRRGFDRPTDGFTFIDLFAGVGGIRRGFEDASIGGHCVYTSEWDSYAVKTYQANYGGFHPLVGDISQPEAKAAVPPHDLLLGGFPCQPFSLAGVSKKNSLGRPHGFDCTTQGTLFYEIEQILAERRPAAFLLENVKNLKSHDQGITFATIMRVLRDELGYHVDARVIDGRHWVPQHRERILIAGFRSDVGFSWDDFKLPEGEAPTLAAILHPEDGSEVDVDEGRYLEPDGRVKDKYTLSRGLWTYLQDYRKKHEARGNGFGYSLFKPGDVARTLSARSYKDGSEILISRGPRKNPRRLTPRECARLMGYDDSFKIPVSDTRAYKQFGNSVIVPLMREAARFMKPYILKVREQEPSSQLPLTLQV